MAREGLMDDSGYDFYVDEDAYNDGFKEGYLTCINEIAEALKEVFESRKVEPSLVDVFVSKLKGE